MRANALLTAAMLTCAACDASLAPPDYPPPSGVIAQAAFKSAFKTDWLDRPFDPRAPEEVDGTNYRKFLVYNMQSLANGRAVEAIAALQRLELGGCVWERYGLNDVPSWSKTRIVKDPKAAYRCAFALHYQVNPPYGEPRTVATEGFFFREANNYVYAGLYETPY